MPRRSRRQLTSVQALRRPPGIQVDSWQELDCGSCLILPKGTPKALVHFLGGAFVGRAPHFTYQVLCRELCDAGFAVATTPYGLTFEHVQCALRLSAAREALVAEAFGADRPELVFGVGHSNGALMHALMASLPEAGPAADANVLISYNNKSVKDAVPFGLPQGSDAVVAAAQQIIAAAPPPPPPPPGPLRDLATGPLAVTLSPIVDQLGVNPGPAFDEIAQGKTEFYPSPAETRRIVGDAYACPATLLVKFVNDSIDESEEIARVLTGGASGKSGRAVEIRRVFGSHVTPCGADLAWEVGKVFTPADAIAQAAKMATLLPTRLAAREVAIWLDGRVRLHQRQQQQRAVVAGTDVVLPSAAPPTARRGEEGSAAAAAQAGSGGGEE